MRDVWINVEARTGRERRTGEARGGAERGGGGGEVREERRSRSNMRRVHERERETGFIVANSKRIHPRFSATLRVYSRSPAAGTLHPRYRPPGV